MALNRQKLHAVVELQPVFSVNGKLLKFNHIFQELILPQKEKHSDIIGMEHESEVVEPESEL